LYNSLVAVIFIYINFSYWVNQNIYTFASAIERCKPIYIAFFRAGWNSRSAVQSATPLTGIEPVKLRYRQYSLDGRRILVG